MKHFLNRTLPLTLSVVLVVASMLFYEEITAPFAFASISTTPIQQQAGNISGCNNGSATITAAANGDLLVFVEGGGNNTCSISSLSSTNTTWNRVLQCNTNRNVEVWKGVVSGGSSGTNVTINMTGTGVANNRWGISEWSGADGSVDSGTQLCNATTGSVKTSATTTPTSSLNVLMIGNTSSGGSETGSPGGGFTDLLEVSSSTPASYRVVSSTSGGYAVTWNWSSALAYDATIVVFKATASGGTTDTNKHVYINASSIYLNAPKILFN